MHLYQHPTQVPTRVPSRPEAWRKTVNAILLWLVDMAMLLLETNSGGRPIYHSFVQRASEFVGIAGMQ